MHNPLISIVTPTFNRAEFLEETILSVLNQNYDNIEYIIIDGGSTDGTLDIIHKYEKYLAFWVSEPDQGMYDAINKGFNQATGDIYAWINSDDVYLPGALEAVSKALKHNPEVAWIHGRDIRINEKGSTVLVPSLLLYHQEDLARGLHGMGARFVSQHCCFWRKDLWLEKGPIPTHLKYAGDYFLWTRFAQKEPLFSLNFPVASFRHHPEQLHKVEKKYQEEMQRCYSGSKAVAALRKFLWQKIARRFTFDVQIINLLTHAPPYRWIDPSAGYSIKETRRVAIK